MTAERPVLYLIDGSNALHRAYHAIRQLSNSKGLPTNAVYGFAAILKKLIREHHPSHVGVAFDISESTARKEAFADYKANRKPMDEDLAVQIPLVRRLCEAFRMPLLELHGFEADDVIATLAKKAAAEDFDVVIFTTDKDFLQLVTPRIRVFQAARELMLDAKGVEEFFGVPPERVGDVLALMGDASDNVPGVPGIGEVTARKLVREFGGLESVLTRAGEVTAKKVRETLTANAELARLSRRLVELDTTLPVAFDPAALNLDPPDLEKLRALYSELEFHSLANELSAEAESAAPAAEARSEDLPEIRDGEAGIFLRRIGADLLFAVSSGGRTFAGVESDESAARRLTPILSDPATHLTTADAKSIYAFGIRSKIEIRAKVFDVSLARYVLACGSSNPEFSALALDLLHRRASTEREAGLESGQLDPAAARNLAAERAAWTRELAPILETELSARENLKRVFDEIETPLIPVLADMEETGVLLDVGYLNELSRGMALDLARLEAEIFSAAGEEFNVASPPQMARILFEKLRLPAGRRTAKTKSFSTGVETLQQLAADGHRIAGLILEHREISKLKGTYADALPALVDEGNRVHARFNQTVAATGRLSSSDPNLQNIPIRTEAGRRIRRAFIAPEGEKLLAADYSQIELRILAHLSGDEAMIRAFSEGVDIHAATASKIFGVAPELVNVEMRTAAKRVNFGLLYGMGASSLARDLSVPLSEARQFVESYFAQFPKVRDTLEAVVEGARRQGFVTTLFGRERPIPEIHSGNGGVRSNAERMAQNAPFQGTAADIVKIAMIRVERRLAEEGLAARMILQVHDELVFEVPEPELDATRKVVVEEMEAAAKLAVPLRVDVGSGSDWLSAKA
jgi:DNA polymerase-1